MRALRRRSLLGLSLGLTIAGLVESACGGGDSAASNGTDGPGTLAPQGGGGKAGAGGASGGGPAAGGASAGAGSGTGGASGTGDGGSSGAAGSTTAGTGGTSAGGAAAGGASAGGASAGGASAGGASAGGAGVGGSSAGAGASGAAGGDGGLDPDAACVADTLGAQLSKKPVDVIIVIDNSGSMTDDIIGVQSNINTNFADIIQASGLDYRVILLSRHGNATTAQSICVSAPLSGTTCMPIPAKPANTTKFFQYSLEVASTNSLSLVLSSFKKVDEFALAPNGWQDWLRADAYKVFLEITDDNSAMAAAAFDTQLLALSPLHFGTATNRNYTWHSIIGLAANTPATAPWLPTDPLQTTKCGTQAVNPGGQYQQLSVLTGGLRFPICDKTKFDVVFQTIAKGVVASGKISCDIPVPPSPPGQTIDPSTIEMTYTPGSGGVPVVFKQVKTLADCGPSSFYITSGTIHLCPAVCATVQADPNASIELLLGCGKL